MASSPFKYINKLQDKRVLVFGGSSGIGLAVAEAALEHGAVVGLVSSNAEKLAEVAEQLKTTYGSHINDGQLSTFSIDLTLPREQLEPELKQAFAQFAPNSAKIHHVVFTAGNVPSMPGLDQVTADDFKDLLVVRTVAPTIIASVLKSEKYMESSTASSITLTGAVNASRPLPGMPVQGPAIGAAIEGLCRGLAATLAPIRVNTVLAGTFDTALTARLSAEVKQKLAQRTMLKKIGKVEDIAEAYIYFMKDESATGVSLVSDNGFMVSPGM
ncbi:hypothetical protein B0I35DRAFT_423668 [Stachybotrys elegans]|uniref:Uncharacterized protein n=1 Tax=Stachybotrys elegans TaxID=80388 RepID=A0A8K0SYC7_9HYPO|nr:hypothetical protein B0I35DRAFT_423668 [Stachybotrys elegans]